MDKTLIEEVCAFANSSGGRILIGVADDGTVTGISASNRLRSQIQDTLGQLQPRLDIPVEVKKNLILIHVPKGGEKPYSCSRGFFMRVGANSQKMTRNEIISFFKKEGRVNFEELINEKASFEKDFDPKAFKYFLKLSGISPAIKRDILLQNLDCLTADKKMTNLGVLFFARDLDFIMNHASVDCALFRGPDKVKILDRKLYKGNIIENIESALAFVQRHTNTEYVITGRPRREEIPDYPEISLREAIVNAVCHRDYFERRCHVAVEVFDDRVEIYNPGGLPSGLDPKSFGTKSVPRNLLIASMLHRASYIERAGTGIGRIKEALAKHKKKVSLEIQYSDESLFYSVIFRKKNLRAAAARKPPAGTAQKALPDTAQKALPDTAQKALPDTAQKAPAGTARKAPAGTAQKAPAGTAWKALPDTAQKALPDTAQKALPDTAQKAPAGTAWKALPDTAQKAPAGTAQKALPDTAQKALPDTAQKAPAGTARKALPDTAQKAPAGTARKALPDTAQKAPAGTAQKAPAGTARKAPAGTAQKTPAGAARKILDLIDNDPLITRAELAKKIKNISSDGVKYHLGQLKKQGFLKRVGPDKGGFWKVIKEPDKPRGRMAKADSLKDQSAAGSKIPRKKTLRQKGDS